MQYPDWLMKAKESKKLLQWIQDPVHSFKMFHGRLLLKCQEEDCIVFYAVDSKEKDCLQLKEPKLCGVLYLPDYFLYEVDTAFYEAVGIPADFIFPTRENLKKEVEGRVTHLVKNLIDTKWDKLLLKYQNIPEGQNKAGGAVLQSKVFLCKDAGGVHGCNVSLLPEPPRECCTNDCR